MCVNGPNGANVSLLTTLLSPQLMTTWATPPASDEVSVTVATHVFASIVQLPPTTGGRSGV